MAKRTQQEENDDYTKILTETLKDLKDTFGVERDCVYLQQTLRRMSDLLCEIERYGIEPDRSVLVEAKKTVDHFEKVFVKQCLRAKPDGSAIEELWKGSRLGCR